MSPLMELITRGRKDATVKRLRRLLARHLAGHIPDDAAQQSRCVLVIPVLNGEGVAGQAFSASAKDFLDLTFSLIASEPLSHRELIIGITTDQVLSLFHAEAAEAGFLGGRLWQTEVLFTDIVTGDQYAQLSARIR